QEHIHHLETFINRFRYQATKARQVQSRIKELEKIERIELPDEEKKIHFSFPQPSPSGRMVAELRGVAKSYGEKKVFENVSFVLNRGDRVALVGVNGAGKSTLIKLLSGAEPVSRGELRLGHNVECDYFAQDQYKVLNPDARLLDDLTTFAPTAVSNQTQLRTLLGSFLFSADDVFKPIGVLSGGERNRYALARMLLKPSNFLLLDEPTNHLDMRAKDVLLEALETFTGTVVFVSHDRYFIDKLATRVFEVSDGQVHVFPGNYEDYLWRKDNPAAPGLVAEPAANNGNKSQPPVPVPELAETASESRAKRMNPIRLKQMKERVHEVEEEITRVEAGIAECENGLQTVVSVDETKRVQELLASRRKALEGLLAEWEEISKAIEAGG